MSDSRPPASLPLFPLQNVLFPDGLLALRVFEVRYLDMVRKCHAAGTPFGVVALRSGSEVRRAGASPEQLHAAGTLAFIDRLESLQPGLITLRCHGAERFHVRKIQQLPHGLWIADVEPMPADQALAVPAYLQNTATALARLLAQLRERDPQALQPAPPSFEQLGDCGWVANRWCELLPVPVEMKQRLMTLDSPLMRLELLQDTLEQMGILP